MTTAAAVKDAEPAAQPRWGDFGMAVHTGFRKGSDTLWSAMLWNLIQLESVETAWDDFASGAVEPWWNGAPLIDVAAQWAADQVGTTSRAFLVLAQAFALCDEDTWAEVDACVSDWLKRPRSNAMKDKAHAAVRRAVRLAAKLKEHEAAGKRLSTESQRLLRREIPELLAEIGTNVWDTPDVAGVSIVSKIGGALSQAKDIEAAVAYLREQEFGSALKTTLTVEFSEEERGLADALKAVVESSMGKEADIDRAVHPQTLAAWARERTKAGIATDLAKIGLSTWREAKLTPHK